MIRYSRAVEKLEVESAFEVLAKAKALERQGREILHFEIGEPDFDTPSHIKEAAIESLRRGHTHYCQTPGLPELREAIAQHISESRGIEVGPEEVMVTVGAKPIMFFSILSCVEEGDEVIYPDPGFPIYASTIRYAGAKAVPVPLLEERGFSFDMEAFRRAVSGRTRMIIINSPQNPTGGILREDDLREIAGVALERGIFVLSDEIYSGMQYQGEFRSIASLPGMKDITILLDGFSKTYAMTGWRLGYGIANRKLVDYFTRLMVNSNSCTPPFIQMAGLAALKGPQDEPKRMVAEFRKRRDLIVSGLNRIPGVSCALPAGAFYAFPNVKSFGKSSDFIADYLLREAGVASLSGTAFGEYGEGYLRFSYANSMENIEKALERIRRALGELS